MKCALIMAGGSGTRFWPKSTKKKPKQFISLTSDLTMIQITVERIKNIFGMDKIFVSTTIDYKELVIEQLPDLPEENIIIEPSSRNTAPCILLSCFYIKKRLGNCNIVVLPSDHIVKNTDEFNKIIDKGFSFIEQKQEGIITIGIIPDRPETGYGYIKIDETNYKEGDILKSEKFVEKPNFEKAIEYVKSKKYLWNAGMFIFNVDYLINEYKENLPNVYSFIKKINESNESDYYQSLCKNYELAEKISFDYGIMEKNNDVYVIPANFGWDDVGTWSSVERYIAQDENKNIIKGNVDLIESNNCIVYANDKKIILCNVENIYCIDSDDVIIIGPKDEINEVYNKIR